MKSQESIEQINVVRYCEWNKIPVFHIPNSGSRNEREAHNLKLQGVKAGVPDLCFPVPMGKYHGMYIERKPAKIKQLRHRMNGLSCLIKTDI